MYTIGCKQEPAYAALVRLVSILPGNVRVSGFGFVPTLQDGAQSITGMPHHGIKMGHRFFEGGVIKSPPLDRRERRRRRLQHILHALVAGAAGPAVSIGPIRRLHHLAQRGEALQAEQFTLRAGQTSFLTLPALRSSGMISSDIAQVSRQPCASAKRAA